MDLIIGQVLNGPFSTSKVPLRTATNSYSINKPKKPKHALT